MIRRATLATRLTIAAVVVALVPLIALAVTFSVLGERAIRREIDAALLARAQNFAALVQSSILEPLGRDNVLRSWSTQPPLRAALRGPQARESCERFLTEATRGVVLGAELLDLRGHPICASASTLNVEADAQAPWFRAALDGSLSSEGTVQGPGGRVLAVAVAVTDEKRTPQGVLRAWYDWGIISAMIDAPVSQARAADRDIQLQISSGDAVLYDTAGERDARLISPGAEATGVGDRDQLLIAWARNDLAATDPGGRFAYVCRIQRSVAFASIRRLVRAVALIVLGGAFAAAVAAWFLSRTLVRPLNALGKAVERIVRDGDLAQRIEVSGDDEIGRLEASFASMVEKLREIPRSLQESALALSVEVERLNKSAIDQNERVARQAAALQEAQITAQQIRATSQMAAEKASAVLGAAERADAVGRSGEGALAESLGELEQILTHVDAISRTMSELGESTSRIAGIAGVVKDLADQSNMLALNAAIEAVRSGEHGRGFAVVAREIRSLADQSIKATQRVQENLDGIRSNAARAVNITEQGSRGIAANLTRVRNSGESLRELGSITRENARAVREIAAAVGQQNAGVDQVFSAVKDLSSSMHDLVGLIEQCSASVREVGSVSARIGGIVGKFRV